MYRLAQTRTAGDDSTPATPTAIERAHAIFVRNHKTALAEGWVDRVHGFIARLVYDSRVQPAAVRFTGVQDQILLTYETDLGEIEIETRRSIDHTGVERWRMMGQISGELAQTAKRVELQLHPTGAIIAQSPVAADGVFELESPAGRFVLIVETDSGRVSVPEMTIG
jgi:hypothetical protein